MAKLSQISAMVAAQFGIGKAIDARQIERRKRRNKSGYSDFGTWTDPHTEPTAKRAKAKAARKARKDQSK